MTGHGARAAARKPGRPARASTCSSRRRDPALGAAARDLVPGSCAAAAHRDSTKSSGRAQSRSRPSSARRAVASHVAQLREQLTVDQPLGAALARVGVLGGVGVPVGARSRAHHRVHTSGCACSDSSTLIIGIMAGLAPDGDIQFWHSGSDGDTAAHRGHTNMLSRRPRSGPGPRSTAPSAWSQHRRCGGHSTPRTSGRRGRRGRWAGRRRATRRRRRRTQSPRRLPTTTRSNTDVLFSNTTSPAPGPSATTSRSSVTTSLTINQQNTERQEFAVGERPRASARRGRAVALPAHQHRLEGARTPRASRSRSGQSSRVARCASNSARRPPSGWGGTWTP